MVGGLVGGFGSACTLVFHHQVNKANTDGFTKTDLGILGHYPYQLLAAAGERSSRTRPESLRFLNHSNPPVIASLYWRDNRTSVTRISSFSFLPVCPFGGIRACICVGVCHHIHLLVHEYLNTHLHTFDIYNMPAGLPACTCSASMPAFPAVDLSGLPACLPTFLHSPAYLPPACLPAY